ncbi:hypothetical protein HJC23_011518 [Cyclotella cryptica]|uniref:GH16 domain-containing protein n=1 Tax=Cyclotella cryptica TaxID=29204 RepID=A0ABD3PU04_9STRA
MNNSRNNRQNDWISRPCKVLLLLAATAASTYGGWVDPDTPKEFYQTESLFEGDSREYDLVFSDEFEQEGRTFEDGTDPRWTAIDKNDYTNEALHFYRPQNVQTTQGSLNISTILKSNKYKAFDEEKLKYYADAKHIQSGMVQGWNKFCMTGGIVEFHAKLPGDPTVGGLWPALWMLGNLARATYVGSSNYIWPYSYNRCDEKNRHSQQISACSKVGHYGMMPGLGRGSPEIDIVEAMMGSDEKLPNTNVTRPYFSTSLQIAPGLDANRPNLGKLPKKGYWYEGLEYGNETQLNPFFYGVTLEHKPKQFTYQSDAISANTHIGKDHFKSFHKYRMEWEPPDDDGTGGYIKWYLDDRFLYGIQGKNLALTKTEIPSEPMYLIMNTAVASSWGFPKPCPEGCDCSCFKCGDPECICGMPDGFCDNFPAFFAIDYVRVYQARGEPKHVLGCSTEKRPTARFIMGHKDDYINKIDGQKEPLLPVQRGGGYCRQSGDCGYPNKGECSSSNKCICSERYTGPNCLSPDGFDDNPPLAEVIEFDQMALSPAMLSMLALAIMVFMLFVGLAVLKRRKQAIADYDQLLDTSHAANRFDADDMARVMVRDRELQQSQLPKDAVGSNEQDSYQKGGGAPYNPMGGANDGQTTVTYCMIDGRLLDEQRSTN